jgi:hypothetical protein
MKRIKSLVYCLLGGLLILPLTPAFADKYGLETAGSSSNLANLAISSKTPIGLMAEIVGIGLSFIGIIFFLIMMYAGLKWMTALGASEKAEKSKEMLQNAAVGLIIVFSAYAIARFAFTALGIS